MRLLLKRNFKDSQSASSHLLLDDECLCCVLELGELLPEGEHELQLVPSGLALLYSKLHKPFQGVVEVKSKHVPFHTGAPKLKLEHSKPCLLLAWHVVKWRSHGHEQYVIPEEKLIADAQLGHEFAFTRAYAALEKAIANNIPLTVEESPMDNHVVYELDENGQKLKDALYSGDQDGAKRFMELKENLSKKLVKEVISTPSKAEQQNVNPVD